MQKIFVLGLNYDIGYEFGNNSNHNIIGGKLLKENNYQYWQEVYYHGQSECKYKSLYNVFHMVCQSSLTIPIYSKLSFSYPCCVSTNISSLKKIVSFCNAVYYNIIPPYI